MNLSFSTQSPELVTILSFVDSILTIKSFKSKPEKLCLIVPNSR